MVKSRMTTADVAAEVGCLRSRLLGMRVANIYDVNAKTYLIKLARSGEDGEKVFMILESGIRFHTAELVPEKADTPSNFTAKLRKHLRTRRLEDIRQLGVDRIVDFTFGSGEAEHHLILELYSQGNVILTDSAYSVLTLLRQHRDDDKGFAIMASHPYPMHIIRLRQPVARSALEDAVANSVSHPKGGNLRSAVGSTLPYGPAVSEHCILEAGLDPKMSLKAVTDLSSEQLDALHKAIQGFEAWVTACDAEGPPGWIGLQGEGENALYVDYEPQLWLQHAGKSKRETRTFDDAMKEFYSKIEGQRDAASREAAKKAALSKLDKIRDQNTERAETLTREAEQNERRAALIEYNLDAVSAVLDAVNAALATGMDWNELAAMIKEEAHAGNPVAALVKKLNLPQNRITIRLMDYDEDPPEEVAVDVDLALNAYQNASALHQTKKKNIAKQAKTIDANEKALKAAEKRVAAQLASVERRRVIQAARKPLWFEKFNWFISSQNYLVLSGRDMQQNELLVKRYLNKGDLYVHADIHGASTTIIKNHDHTQPVPPATIQQAGSACMCRSKAWDNKIVSSAWWVYHTQVSKTAPTGEYLGTGSFMIRGKKNFLPPSNLVMGFGFLFRLDDESLAAHIGERNARAEDARYEALPPVSDEDDDQADEDGADADDADKDDADEDSADGDDPDKDTSEADVDAPDAVGVENAGAEVADKDGADADTADEDGADANRAASDTADRDDADEAEPAPAAVQASTASSALDAFLEGSADTFGVQSPAAPAHPAPADAKYGLDDAALQPDESLPEEVARAAAAGDGKKHAHVSAKLRRQMRKAGVKTASELPTTMEQAENEAAEDKAPEATGEDALAAARAAERERIAKKKEAAEAEAKRAAAVRGKKGKAKKAERKYADQDEEDRALARAALASDGARMDKAARKAARKEKRATRKAATTSAAPAPDADVAIAAIEAATRKAAPQKLQEAGGRAAEAAEKPEEAAAGSGRNLQEGASDPGEASAGGPEVPNWERRERRAAKKREEEEIAALKLQENITEISEEDLKNLTQIDALTGAPKAADGLLHAVPVCAPYNVLASYKYKVKLVPGNQKKGKAARAAVEMLVRGAGSSASRTEVELLRAVPEGELVAAMLGGVKVSLPGMAALAASAKKSKKAAAQGKASG